MDESSELNAYIIAFETTSENDEVEMINRIKKFPKWARLMKGVWMVKTKKKSVTIRDELKALSSTDSKIFVTRTSKGWAYKGLTVGDWIKKNV